MAREILFKAKRIDNGEWVEGFFVNCKDEYEAEKGPIADIVETEADRIYVGEYNCFHAHKVDINTLCQFTGLYDGTKWEDLTEEEKQEFYNKNCSEDGRNIKYQHIEDVKHLWKGKKIWENDIVKYHFGDDVAVIRYGKYHSCFDSTKACHVGFFVDWEKGYMRKDLGYWVEMIDCNIVGNVIDNPELLEGGE